MVNILFINDDALLGTPGTGGKLLDPACGTRAQIAEIVRRYGGPADGETVKTFDNADFGYTRVTCERPLRLRYQMTLEDKARFLDACPHLLEEHLTTAGIVNPTFPYRLALCALC